MDWVEPNTVYRVIDWTKLGVGQNSLNTVDQVESGLKPLDPEGLGL